jgi:hypothetical protein
MTFSPFAMARRRTYGHETAWRRCRLPINGDFVSFGHIRKRYRDVIQRMDLDVLHTNTRP